MKASKLTKFLLTVYCMAYLTAGCSLTGKNLFNPDGDIIPPQPTGSECSGLEGSGSECEGGLCLGLKQNDQGKDGLCSQSCEMDSDCNGTEDCLSDGTSTEGYCFRECTKDSDCRDGFLCSSAGYCLVTQGGVFVGGTMTPAKPTTDGVTSITDSLEIDCEKDCQGNSYTEKEFLEAWCPDIATAKQLCNCDNGVSPGVNCTLTDAANLWCCP